MLITRVRRSEDRSMATTPDPKTMAKSLRAELRSRHQVELTHSQCLELVARPFGNHLHFNEPDDPALRAGLPRWAPAIPAGEPHSRGFT
jgi:hypothetical protein